MLGQIKKEIRIAWEKQTFENGWGKTDIRFYFEKADYDSEQQQLPIWVDMIPMHDENIEIAIVLSDLIYDTIPPEEITLVDNCTFESDFTVEHALYLSRNNPLLQIKMLPFRQKENNIERLLSCTIEIRYKEKRNHFEKKKLFATTSLLESGNWYKLRVNKSGIFKITHANLVSMGINPSEIDPRNIRIYGYGGGILPEANNALKYDDLVENPIVVYGEEDGKFDNNDYILFYSQGPITWNYNSNGYFTHINNFYDDYTYVFLTTDLGVGSRVEMAESVSGETTTTFNCFIDRQMYEVDTYNILNMGREWYGDFFDITLNKSYSFDFPNILTNRKARIITRVASRNSSSASFILSINGEIQKTMSMGFYSQYTYADAKTENFQFDPNSNTISVGLRYNRASTSSTGWLDYISINAWRSLVFTGSQLAFRNPEAKNTHGRFVMTNANSNIQVWDVSEPTSPKRIKTTLANNTLSFASYSNIVQEFIAFDGSQYHNVEFVAKVNNQNLHGIRNIDYLIITHPRFMAQAERLANLRQERDGFTTYITTPELIYNEFSSGGKDISAIRNFTRMLYKESDTGRELRYLVLLGDASFDYKNRSGEFDLVPTYQSTASLNLTNSYPADDYYGLLDEDEGSPESGLVDIGIGRFPVNTAEEATNMIDKIENYLKKDDQTMTPWRNVITLVSDDDEEGKGQYFMRELEMLEEAINKNEPAINIDKIYLDAYPQIATSGGQRAPTVNDAINKRMAKGNLIVNYIGHGGEIGWTQERILQISDINSWRNGDKLPLFITGTCEFSRFDDHTRTSAGELVFLNKHGGAIAMFTTTRATTQSPNLTFNLAVYRDNLFSFQNGEYARLGDVLRTSKLGTNSYRKLVLFGDPALQLAYPQLNVVTSKINEHSIGMLSTSDTLKALEPVTIEGYIADYDGNIIDSYNGIIYTTVYDKEKEITTYGDEAAPFTFKLRNSILFNGKTSVTNGRFKVSFTMPKDISYNYGNGRISYYATNYEHDANGYYEDIQIGGFYENILEDEKGPEIQLYIDDTLFVSGGITNENPLLLALVSDESGINTTGAGIGHDIVAKLSGATTASFILNDYFEGELNDSQNGIITYPLLNLNAGNHTLTLKVWDIHNNSSEASISFEVVNSKQSAVKNLYNYPNPFSNETHFVFDHNQIGNNMTVEIQIFDLNGQLVHTIKQYLYGTSTRSNPIKWDGSTKNGHVLTNGLYIYRLLLTNEHGETTDKRSKLLYIR